VKLLALLSTVFVNAAVYGMIDAPVHAGTSRTPEKLLQQQQQQ
jgi:hypothetical protein